jgi:hypothetical protein
MHKFLLGSVTAIAITVGGCSTTQTQQIETFIGQVQADAALVCKFIPDVATIISLVNSGIGQIAGLVVQAVCNSIPPPASARYKALPLRSGGGAAVTVAPGISGWRTQ